MAEPSAMTSPVVLLGGGHAHVEVVRRLGQLGLGREVTLVSPSRHAPYSGMLPGYIAGEYNFDDFHIDLAALCTRFGVTVLQDVACGIDPERRAVSLASGVVLGYGVLSINIGATPLIPEGISAGISVKPIATFADRLTRLDVLADQGRLSRLAVVGQGVAGVEVVFALKQRFGARNVSVVLVGRAAQPVPERSCRARQLLEREFRTAGISHCAGFDAMAFHDGELIARDGRRMEVDEVVWTTSSGAPPFLRRTGLRLDDNGFIRVDKTLRSLSHPDVFAAGDVSSLLDPRPKAGVFAVRQGPVLAENIHRTLVQKSLKAYRPQSNWLVLISLADGRAIADKWAFAVLGRWVARWKHRIDSQFMRRYR